MTKIKLRRYSKHEIQRRVGNFNPSLKSSTNPKAKDDLQENFRKVAELMARKCSLGVI